MQFLRFFFKIGLNAKSRYIMHKINTVTLMKKNRKSTTIDKQHLTGANSIYEKNIYFFLLWFRNSLCGWTKKTNGDSLFNWFKSLFFVFFFVLLKPWSEWKNDNNKLYSNEKKRKSIKKIRKVVKKHSFFNKKKQICVFNNFFFVFSSPEYELQMYIFINFSLHVI